MDLKLDFDINYNIVTICGRNNVGKTNMLRAINLFFNPSDYDPQIDIPEIKKATWGGLVHPKIILEFLDEDNQYIYKISRDLNPRTFDKTDGLAGSKKKYRKRQKQKELSLSEIQTLLKGISFNYIESINLIVPEVITKITDEMITLEYDKARFSKSKKALRDAYIEYVTGLQDILDGFAQKLSTVFKDFRDNWNVRFQVPKNADSFRNLISDDVILSIDDTGSVGIDDKGSGLQRLALLLLQFEVIDRLVQKKSSIILIDEPDLYLHEGLQYKFLDFLQKKSQSIQVIYTTHSRIFINTYKMKNLFLLDADINTQFVKRRNRNVNVTKTYFIDYKSDDGYQKICDHLGIKEEDYELLEEQNLLVEGGCDKKYIGELIKFFDLPKVNIIPANGADNILQYLNLYESYYHENKKVKPIIRVILDNDAKGRKIYLQIQKKTYNFINIELLLLPNFLGDFPTSSEIEGCKTNNEIEDFLYPELFCYLVNKLLERKNLQLIDSEKVCTQIKKAAFKESGILALCDHEKNEKNLDDGNLISFIGSDNSSNAVKEGLAGFLTIEGNKKVIDIIERNDQLYSSVRGFLEKITTQGIQP